MYKVPVIIQENVSGKIHITARVMARLTEY